MIRARKFVENVYYHELSKELIQFGYRIENKQRGDFEVQGVPNELCERFSKRHQEIDEEMAKLIDSDAIVRDEKKMREAISLDKRAETVSGFLTRRQMPSGAVVLVDEAGQIGAKQMLELLRFIHANGGRAILSGGTLASTGPWRPRTRFAPSSNIQGSNRWN